MILKAMALVAGTAFPAFAASPYGILLLAHGGNPSWNREIANIARQVSKDVPVEVGLGMADGGEIQRAVDRLSRKGVARIVAVPLFINSASELFEQTRYVLGLSAEPSREFEAAMAASMERPGAHHHGATGNRGPSVRSPVPIVMTGALDDDPLAAQIVLGRARNLSRNPAQETVVLVGHGPLGEKANQAWLDAMGRIAATVRKEGGFQAAVSATLRDDSPAPVKERARVSLREIVRSASSRGRVIVIPFLIAQGGVEAHIKEYLEGLSYAWDGKTLAPHPNLAVWVKRTARKHSSQ